MGVLKKAGAAVEQAVSAEVTKLEDLIGQKVAITNTLGDLRHPKLGEYFEKGVEKVVELDHWIIGQIRARRVKATLEGSDEPLNAAIPVVKSAAPVVNPAAATDAGSAVAAAAAGDAAQTGADGEKGADATATDSTTEKKQD